MIWWLSVFSVILPVIVSSDVFIDKAILSLFLCTTLSSGQEVEYHQGNGVQSESEPPTAKIELILMLDPAISNNMDMDYAEVEFCRLFAEVQEIFDTMTERKVIVEFSALFHQESMESAVDMLNGLGNARVVLRLIASYKKSAEHANYVDNNVIFEENGTIDVVGTLNDLAKLVEGWDQKYDVFLFVTRRPLVAKFENETVGNLTGYSIPGGACRPGENIAIAQYSFKNIMHQITHLLGAVHVNDIPPNPNKQCVEGNYTNVVVDSDAYFRWTKSIANCTKKYMIDFLKTPNATCLYSENILDQLDCDTIIPEIG